MDLKRVFLIVLDSFGIGEAPDASAYGDAGSNTLAAAASSRFFFVPNMGRLGLFSIDGVTCGARVPKPAGAFARMTEASKGKDTTIGHWEIAGLVSPQPLPTYPNGFPEDLLKEFSRRVGRGVLCNRPYSGTEVIRDYGEEMLRTGSLIVYTSADSVFQIAAHVDAVPLPELYRACEIARELCTGKNTVGRIIARPFAGKAPFARTPDRRDYSLEPPGETMLDVLKSSGRDVIAVGKIQDIFAGRGITRSIHTAGNAEGITSTLELLREPFCGLCFVNLVDFDMLYGHRNDVDGYARALSEFDVVLPELLRAMGPEDVLMITADHGCDPSTPSTDHSREYTPWLIAGPGIQAGTNLGTLPTFADISATILELFGLAPGSTGSSHSKELLKMTNDIEK